MPHIKIKQGNKEVELYIDRNSIHSTVHNYDYHCVIMGLLGEIERLNNVISITADGIAEIRRDVKSLADMT